MACRNSILLSLGLLFLMLLGVFQKIAPGNFDDLTAHYLASKSWVTPASRRSDFWDNRYKISKFCGTSLKCKARTVSRLSVMDAYPIPSAFISIFDHKISKTLMAKCRRIELATLAGLLSSWFFCALFILLASSVVNAQSHNEIGGLKFHEVFAAILLAALFSQGEVFNFFNLGHSDFENQLPINFVPRSSVNLLVFFSVAAALFKRYYWAIGSCALTFLFHTVHSEAAVLIVIPALFWSRWDSFRDEGLGKRIWNSIKFVLPLLFLPVFFRLFAQNQFRMSLNEVVEVGRGGELLAIDPISRVPGLLLIVFFALSFFFFFYLKKQRTLIFLSLYSSAALVMFKALSLLLVKSEFNPGQITSRFFGILGPLFGGSLIVWAIYLIRRRYNFSPSKILTIVCGIVFLFQALRFQDFKRNWEYIWAGEKGLCSNIENSILGVCPKTWKEANFKRKHEAEVHLGLAHILESCEEPPH